jgi:DNA (cytosine-5)-methyltransferase 1
MGTVVDLFCGAGGLSYGFKSAGYEVRFGSDIDPTFGQTFLNSHEDAKFVAKPVDALSASEILKASRLKKGELDVLVGGPPCQGYSVYNHGRGEDDPRSGLFKEYIRLLKGLQPKWLVMENVTGLTSISGGRLLDEILLSIRSAGYPNVEYRVLKTEEFGVPQERRRIIFIANRLGLPVLFPKPTFGPNGKPYTTIWDAIGDLPPIFQQAQFEQGAPYASAPASAYQKLLRDRQKTVQNHYGPKLSKTNLERIRHIPSGGSWRDIPVSLLPEGMKRAKRSDHTKRYGRPRMTDLSCTILTKCDIHWGAYIHPIQNRAFTVREAARIQSFPDSFIFHGSMTEQFVQVGNAVPPMLAKAIAETINHISMKYLQEAA